MQINANEIDSIEDAGELGSQPVKMIRTKGGLWIAVGTPLGKLREEALAAGSHPAIVKYNVEKKYPDFMPSLQKSEKLMPQAKVMQHSHFLSEDLRKSGYDIHSVETPSLVEFFVTQHGAARGVLNATIVNESLVIKKSLNPHGWDHAIGKGLVGAIAEKALTAEFKDIRFSEET